MDEINCTQSISLVFHINVRKCRTGVTYWRYIVPFHSKIIWSTCIIIYCIWANSPRPLQWRHKKRCGVSTHWQSDCSFISFFRLQWLQLQWNIKHTQYQPFVIHRSISSRRASCAESFSRPWRLHAILESYGWYPYRPRGVRQAKFNL